MSKKKTKNLNFYVSVYFNAKRNKRQLTLSLSHSKNHPQKLHRFRKRRHLKTNLCKRSMMPSVSVSRCKRQLLVLIKTLQICRRRLHQLINFLLRKLRQWNPYLNSRKMRAISYTNQSQSCCLSRLSREYQRPVLVCCLSSPLMISVK